MEEKGGKLEMRRGESGEKYERKWNVSNTEKKKANLSRGTT